MAGHRDDIVNPTSDPVVSVFVPSCAVSGKEVAGIRAEISVQVASVISENSPRDPWPSAGIKLQAHKSGYIVSFQFFPGLNRKDCRLDAKEREGAGTGFRRMGAGKSSQENSTSLGHPPSIANRSFSVTADRVIPLPRLWADRLSDRSHHPQTRPVVLLDPATSSALQGSNGGRSGVEVGELVSLDHVPEPRRVWEGRDAFKEQCGYSKRERAIKQIGMSGDPTNVGLSKDVRSLQKDERPDLGPTVQPNLSPG